MKQAAAYIGLAVVFVWFMFGGIAHFTNAEFFVAIVPPYLPWHLEIVYLSGVLEIVFAAMLLPPATRQLAGNLLVLLTLAVTPANLHMWMHPERFPEVSEGFLTLRLAVQVVLLWLIWWSTRTARWDSSKNTPEGQT